MHAYGLHVRTVYAGELCTPYLVVVRTVLVCAGDGAWLGPEKGKSGFSYIRVCTVYVTDQDNVCTSVLVLRLNLGDNVVSETMDPDLPCPRAGEVPITSWG